MTLSLLPLLAACAPETDGGVDAADEPGALASLTLSQGEVWPALSGDQQFHAVEGADLVAETTTVSATAADPEATVTIRHLTVDGVELDSGGAEAELAWGAGERLEITVTAPGGTPEVIAVTALPDDLPEVTTEVLGEPSEGYFFLGAFDFDDQPEHLGRTLMIVDNAGVPVWFQRHEQPGFDFRVGATGELSFVGLADGHREMKGLVLDPSTFEELDEFLPERPEGSERATMDPHEFQVLADGTLIGIGLGHREEDLRAFGGARDTLVVDQLIQEFDPAGEQVFAWSTEGQVDYGILPDAVLDAISDGWDYAHANAFDLDPDDDNLVISLRSASQVLKVARQPTTWRGQDYAAGEVMWRLGVDGDFTFVGDDRDHGWRGFAGQHSARVLPGDQLLLFDNATDYDGGDTGDCRAVIYQLDHDTGTAERVWEHALAGAGASPAAGSVQRLDGDHTVIGWGAIQDWQGEKAPAATELDASGEPVLRLRLEDNLWSYRVWKFQGDPLTGSWTP